MAIYSSVPPPEQQVPATATSPTTTAPGLTAGLASLSISAPAQGSGVSLSIPLDAVKAVKARKERLRRDSMKHREALLKGKEGSRRRQRWENDRFLNVPNAQPPLPSDWEIHPTYPVHSVPYYLAPLWDLRTEHARKPSSSKNKSSQKSNEQKGRIPSDLKAKLKRSKGAKTLLQELEEEVRNFVKEHERQERLRASGRDEDDEPELDSEDEEIVFVGRNGKMSDLVRAEREKAESFLQREKCIWEGGVDEQGGGFGRWLVHSIAEYYGLSSRSVTVGDPARREAYVGIKTLPKSVKMKTGREVSISSRVDGELPRPLYGLI
ncbi:hypothetical protein HYFRA_00005201 [Hymenoscyphus fraxineus]|uniref:R3H-associated N-terminal domain-containing protein n=1 Tax=Hymenoscyphus fraxineus TaxID=746836 RepID=A0A9N9L846_9HELO|nr:hypothetical protein HYFRA_00005201 [Hymenoscyphus fraxineus]